MELARESDDGESETLRRGAQARARLARGRSNHGDGTGPQGSPIANLAGALHRRRSPGLGGESDDADGSGIDWGVLRLPALAGGLAEERHRALKSSKTLHVLSGRFYLSRRKLSMDDASEAISTSRSWAWSSTYSGQRAIPQPAHQKAHLDGLLFTNGLDRKSVV